MTSRVPQEEAPPYIGPGRAVPSLPRPRRSRDLRRASLAASEYRHSRSAHCWRHSAHARCCPPGERISLAEIEIARHGSRLAGTSASRPLWHREVAKFGNQLAEARGTVRRIHASLRATSIAKRQAHKYNHAEWVQSSRHINGHLGMLAHNANIGRAPKKSAPEIHNQC